MALRKDEKTGHLTGKYIQCYKALRVFVTSEEEVKKLQRRVWELEEKLAQAPSLDPNRRLQEQQETIMRMQQALEEPGTGNSGKSGRK